MHEDCVVFDFDANARSEGDSSAVWEGEVERVCFERGPRDCVFHSKHVDAVRIPLRRPGVIQLLESNENYMDRVVRVRRVWDKTDIRSVLEFTRVDVSGVILQIKEILEPAVDAQKSLGSSGDVNGADASGMTVIAEEEYARYLGVIAVTAASCLSGLASTSTQISLQALRRSAQVLTIEMAIASIPIVYFVHVSKLAFGDELFVQQAQPHLHEEQDEAAATPTPTGNLVSSAAIQRLLYAGSTKWSSMFDNFTFLTFIPIFTSAIGGICVGLVTKNLGSVAKGFAITLGLILTGVIESVTRGEMLQTEQIVGLLLVGACTHAHTVYAVHEPLVTNSRIRIAQANAERRDRQKKRIRDQSAKKFA